jgi:simple sugar transport system permease protein
MPGVHEVLAGWGIEWPRSPLNLSVLLAAICALGVYLMLWRSRPGYALRAVGHAPDAAHYAGIHPRHQVVMSMALSGALAGLVGINEVAGVHGRLLLEFVAGAGFAGIAVSLIGRNHPIGIVLASLLFGALYQGGAELAFEIPGFSRDMVYTLQGLIVLFSGAMAQVAAPTLARFWFALQRQRRVAADNSTAEAAGG